MTNRTQTLVIALGLILLSLVVFWPATGFEFLDFDDQDYVAANPYVLEGLTPTGLKWAFGAIRFNYWLPLTWTSYMLETELHGGSATGFHTTNILLHTLNTLLLFFVMRRMTKNNWTSAFIAALFCAHPLRLETVAWISDRKDLLNGLFWMLGLGAYVRYTEKRSVARYLPILLCMVLGLMTKQMIVVFPAVLLLLDCWPLRRFNTSAWKGLILEKIPLLTLSVGAGIATYFLHPNPGGANGAATFPLAERILMLPLNYTTYLRRFFWPANLCPAYEFTLHPPVAGALIAGLGLLVVTAGLVILARRQPAPLVGWLWFLAGLLPVAGLVRIGNSDTADRFTYIASIGLGILLASAVADRVTKGQIKRKIAILMGCTVIAASALATRAQIGHWRNSEALGRRCVAVAPNSFFAWNILGRAMELQRNPVCVQHYTRALEIAPWFTQAHINLGNVLAGSGKTKEAEKHFRYVLETTPENGRAHSNFGSILYASGEEDEGLMHLQKGVELDPSLPDSHFNFGWALIQSGRNSEALPAFLETIRINPNDDLAHFWAGTIVLRQAGAAEARPYFERCVALKPNREEYAKILQELNAVP